MKRYMPIIGISVILFAMAGITDVDASVASGPSLLESRLLYSDRVAPESMIAPLLIGHRHKPIVSTSDSASMVDEKSWERRDLRFVDWRSGSDPGQKLLASHWEQEDDREEEEVEDEEKNGEDAEGFDRLWDVSNLG